jgi:hypothetical protein
VTDICLFEGRPIELSTHVIDIAWRNYFGTSHGFSLEPARRAAPAEPRRAADYSETGPLQL